jgi:palmitoyltransferase
LRQNLSYTDVEEQRERDRYADYLDERDSEHLPNAFDLGWRRNAKQVFGSNPLLWWLPVCNSEGDGWTWEPSQKWLTASEDIKRRREAEMQIERQSQHADGLGQDNHFNQSFGLNRRASPVPSKADRVLGRIPDQYADGSDWGVRSQGNSTPLQRVSPSRGPLPHSDGTDDYESSSDEERADGRTRLLKPPQRDSERNWNDVPDHFIDGRTPNRKRDKSR